MFQKPPVNFILFVAEMSKAWPPCMRIIVKETTVKTIQVGSLFIITYAGGTLGREGEHAILIPDINISKVIYQNRILFKIPIGTVPWTLTEVLAIVEK